MNKETNPAPQIVYQQYPDQDDEIDISELFNKIWLRRKFIIALVVIAAVISLGLLSTIMLADPPEKRFSEILQFNFPAAEKGLYPGGQRFSYNDIVSAKVLEEVYKRNDLKRRGVKFDEFIDAITVNPFSENEIFIREKYQSLLADKKLTRPEIEALEKAYLEELQVTQSRFVRLSFLESGLEGLDEIMIEKILLDIPRVWSQLSIEELGVLNLKIVGANFYQPEMIQRFEYLQTLEYLKSSSRNLQKALSTLLDDEVGGFVRDPATGQTVVDLNIQLKNLNNFEIEPLFATVTNLGITKDSKKALIYMKNMIQTLSDEKEVLMNKSSNIERIVNQYTESNSLKSNIQSSGSAGGFAQYDSSFLDKFTSLIEEKNDKAYKQALLNQRLLVLQKIEEVDGQIVKFVRAEKILKDSAEAVSGDVRADVIESIALARTSFENLILVYQTLLAVRNQQVMGNIENLYQVTSNAMIVESGLKGRLKKVILYTVLASIVALMLAVVIALFRAAPQRRLEESSAK